MGRAEGPAKNVFEETLFEQWREDLEGQHGRLIGMGIGLAELETDLIGHFFISYQNCHCTRTVVLDTSPPRLHLQQSNPVK